VQPKPRPKVAGYRIKFSIDGNEVSFTGIQNGKQIWTANRSGE
jgi:hypothetical protein